MSQIKQSVCWWCFAMIGMTPAQLLRAAADIGYSAVELIEPEHWPLVKEYGLVIASINGGLSIEQGLNRREHHAHIEQRIRATIVQVWTTAWEPRSRPKDYPVSRESPKRLALPSSWNCSIVKSITRTTSVTGRAGESRSAGWSIRRG